ncbi:MAG: ATP-binding cassette domain-containing protein [Deltaproteobacteria bacterium]|nr:ATP-binding cassette domain-containing protein [Deltaproteobacteria bacterium]
MTPSSDSLLEVSNLIARRGAFEVLKALDLAVGRGTLHAVVGPNGAGKSTLVLAILGMIPFEGRVRFHFERGGRIGYVPQRLAVDRTIPLTVEDFLATSRQRLPVCLATLPTTKARIALALAKVGLSHSEKKPLASLSGGELQRVLLAHALEPLPELLVLDEPSAGLDESSGSDLDDILVEAKQNGVTTLLVSHDSEQVARLADTITQLGPSP